MMLRCYIKAIMLICFKSENSNDHDPWLFLSSPLVLIMNEAKKTPSLRSICFISVWESSERKFQANTQIMNR